MEINQKAPNDKKMAQKTNGLDDQEIALAFENSAQYFPQPSQFSDGIQIAVGPQHPPFLPPRPTVYVERPFYIHPRNTFVKSVFFTTLFLGTGVVALFSLVKILLRPLFIKFISKYAKHTNSLSKKIATFVSSIAQYCKFYAPKLDPSNASLPSTLSSSSQDIEARLQNVTKSITDLSTRKKAQSYKIINTDDESKQDLRSSVDSLTQLITQETYFAPHSYGSYSGKDDSSSMSRKRWVDCIDSIKGEVRSIKGLMLSRKNFP